MLCHCINLSEMLCITSNWLIRPKYIHWIKRTICGCWAINFISTRYSRNCTKRTLCCPFYQNGLLWLEFGQPEQFISITAVQANVRVYYTHTHTLQMVMICSSSSSSYSFSNQMKSHTLRSKVVNLFITQSYWMLANRSLTRSLTHSRPIDTRLHQNMYVQT